MLNYPDPFEHPNAYYRLTMNDAKLDIYEKRQMLKAVGMEYGKEPRPSGLEILMRKKGAA